jgi:asparagine synthase (glutamine-hydrolysing)
MCGICGWVDFDRDLGRPDARKELANMTATIASRGPDDEELGSTGS